VNRIEQHATKLRLPNTRRNYQFLVNQAIDNSLSYEAFLDLILDEEMKLRELNGINSRIRKARFPYLKTFEDFRFDALSAEISGRIRELQSLNFLDFGQNVILVGNPGVGKTHTAIALGVNACRAGKSVLFITVPNLITELKESMTLNQLTRYKKKFVTYDLVILDELGYISFDRQGGELLFNLLSMRNDTKSIVITTNLSFDRWQEVFQDPVLTTAMVDRLTHRAHVISINGDSYRLKETMEWLNR